MGNIRIILKLFKQDILKNIVIIIQIIFSIFVLTTLLTEIIYGYETKKLLKDNKFDDKVVFAEALHINRIMGSEGRNEKYTEIKEYLQSLDGVKSVSNVYITQLQNQDFATYLYDEELIKDLRFELIAGQNFGTYVSQDKVIPIIVSESLQNKYKLNNEYEFSIIELKSYFDMDFSEKFFKVKVIGILKDNAYIYGFSTNQYDLQSSDLFSKTNKGEEFILMPKTEEFANNERINVEGKFTIEVDDMNLFMQNSYQKVLDEGIGRFINIENINGNFYTNFLSFYSYNIKLFLIVYLFIIMSVGGYNLLATLKYKRLLTIYYINGMTWKKGICLVTIRNFILIMLPAVITSILCNLFIKRYELIIFDIKTIIITSLLYLFIFVITTLGMVATLRKISPNEVLREND